MTDKGQGKTEDQVWLYARFYSGKKYPKWDDRNYGWKIFKNS